MSEHVGTTFMLVRLVGIQWNGGGGSFANHDQAPYDHGFILNFISDFILIFIIIID